MPRCPRHNLSIRSRFDVIMRMRRIATTGAALALITMAGPAVAGPKAEIVDFGVVVGRLVDSQPEAGQRALEPVRAMQKLRYIERSDRIEARLCRNFGITVRLIPTPPFRTPDRVEVREPVDHGRDFSAVRHPDHPLPSRVRAAAVPEPGRSPRPAGRPRSRPPSAAVRPVARLAEKASL